MADLARIIFWQPIDSPHQEAFLEAVAEHFPGEVLLGVEQELPPERIAQGWRKPVHRRVKVVDISIPANHAALAAHAAPDSLHVFSGFFSHSLVWSGFRKLAPSHAHLAIYSEAPEHPLLTGWLKRLRGHAVARRWAQRFAFVLAVGGIGCEFFEAIGVPKEKIIPFGYYLAVPPLAATDASLPRDDAFRFISAGQLIRRKGVDLLIRACLRLPSTGWHLDIYGDGPERAALERLTSRLTLSERITFHGAVRSDQIAQMIAAADCAVLPSRFDGWGMLVNEALAVGTPVICTKSCGAAALLAHIGIRGEPPAALPAPLAAALQNALASGPPPQDMRQGLRTRIAAIGSAACAAGRVLSVACRLSAA